MGYTHYYTVYGANPDFKIPEIAEDIRAIIGASEIEIGDAWGTPGSEAELGPDRIALNGIAPDDYEALTYPPDSDGFEFCKTARRAYDPVVAASLMVIKHHLGDNVEIASDGNFDDVDEWGPAYQLYTRALNREVPVSFRGYADEACAELTIYKG